jgi:serine/threonine-protein kinase
MMWGTSPSPGELPDVSVPTLKRRSPEARRKLRAALRPGEDVEERGTARRGGTMALNPQVLDLLLRWEEGCERGEALSPEELCRDCPELLPEVRQRIRELREVPPSSTFDLPGEGGPGWLGPYRVLRLLGHGGMGEVYVADDADQRRQVAVKRLRPSAAGQADRRRFLREAEIAGGLEHPGVVPVYGLTRDADGRPSYAMRLVRGQTLQEAIRRLHDPGAARGNPGLLLRQLLNRFVAVCNTMAYAHSRGVIHRDLKPANILLGDYGETLVIDWGVAKRLAPSGEGDGNATPGAGPPGADGGETAAGEVLGTPAYMSPEQAAGRGPEVGPASDIYSLGATLYTLLTNRAPPASGSGGPVGAGPLPPPPRQVNPAVPRALEAVCLKAMAPAPERRYATALELAEDVERWLADEPVRAYREPRRIRARRWVRRHRTLVAVLGVSVLLTAAAVAGGWWWFERDRAARQAEATRRETEARVAVEAFLGRAADHERRAEWAEARAALAAAEARLGEGGPEDLRGRVVRARADLTLVARLDRIREGRLTISSETLEPDTAAAAPAYAQAFRDHDLDVEGEVAAVAERVRQSAVKAQLLAALDDWAEWTADARLRARLLDVARRADPDPWRDRFRDPVVRADVRALRRLAADVPVEALSPALLEALANHLWRQGIDDLELRRRVQARYPDDYFLNQALVLSLARQTHQLRGAEADLVREEAIGFAHSAVAARPGSALGWSRLGVLLSLQGRFEEAEAAQRKALSLQPDNALFLTLYSAPLRGLGRFGEAERAAREAIALKPNYAMAYSMLANALLSQERFAEAEAHCHRAIRLQPDYANAYVNLARALRGQGKVAEANAAEREGEHLQPGIVSKFRIWPAEHQARLERKLPAWLRGEYRPADALELTVLGSLAAHHQGRFDAAARLFAKAFADRPEFAEATVDFSSDRPRYFAACCAARASLGLGDAWELNAESRGQRRRQAVAWLRQELASWDREIAENRPAARVRAYRALGYWQTDSWLDGVREDQVPGWLPPADREACRKLWADVATSLNRLRASLDGAEPMARLEDKVPAWLRGDYRPGDALELTVLAFLAAHRQGRYDAAARLFAKAFADRPEFAEATVDFPSDRPRYFAACCAARASLGLGDAWELNAESRGQRRRQALAWLRQELAYWDEEIAEKRLVARVRTYRVLRFWQKDGWLDGLREARAGDPLPPAESEACRALWADVAASLKRLRASLDQADEEARGPLK